MVAEGLLFLSLCLSVFVFASSIFFTVYSSGALYLHIYFQTKVAGWTSITSEIRTVCHHDQDETDSWPTGDCSHATKQVPKTLVTASFAVLQPVIDIVAESGPFRKVKQSEPTSSKVPGKFTPRLGSIHSFVCTGRNLVYTGVISVPLPTLSY